MHLDKAISERHCSCPSSTSGAIPGSHRSRFLRLIPVLVLLAALPRLAIAQSFNADVREVEISLDLSSSCLQERCEKTGDCNAHCADVSPMFAKVFWKPPGSSTSTLDAGKARQVRWTVRCYTQPIGRDCEDSSFEECITRSPCLEPGDVLRIVPSSDPEAKQVLMNQRFPTMAAQHGYGATPKVARPDLFGRMDWRIEGPHNAILSGVPLEPGFDSSDSLLEWFYDVELVRGGKVILRVDPEFWLEEDP